MHGLIFLAFRKSEDCLFWSSGASILAHLHTPCAGSHLPCPSHQDKVRIEVRLLAQVRGAAELSVAMWGPEIKVSCHSLPPQFAE